MASGLPGRTEASIPQFRFPDAPAASLSVPHLYGSATLAFGGSKAAPAATRIVTVVLPLEPGMRSADWDRAQPVDILPQQLVPAPAKLPGPLPAFVTDVPRFSKVARDFHRWLGRTQRMETSGQAPLRPRRGGTTVDLVAVVWK